MKRGILWRGFLVGLLIALAVVLVLPSITSSFPTVMKGGGRINLGLDLQGGIFLRLRVELDKAVEKYPLAVCG